MYEEKRHEEKFIAGMINSITRMVEGWIREDLDRLAKGGYNPNQPRVPAGHSDGGQWTGGGITQGRTKSKIQKPRVYTEVIRPAPGAPPVRRVLTTADIAERARRINATAPAGTPPDLLELDPITGYPKWYVGGMVAPSLSPLDFIGLPVRGAGGVVVTEFVAARNAARLKQYLKEARQIPKGVTEVGKGASSLSTRQIGKLEGFSKERSKRFEEIEIIKYSDGRAVFSTKQPARDIPNSYAIWEKQVSKTGDTIRIYKTVVGPDGALVHIKNYIRK